MSYSPEVSKRARPGVSKRDRPGGKLPDPALLCLPCMMLGTVRQAWTISDGRACCIRHAVEDAGLDDDMAEHDLFVVLYEALRQQGHPDAH
jgi:hypothetical protein